MKKTLKEIVMLWHKTKYGNVNDTVVRSQEFSEIMMELYEKYKKQEEKLKKVPF